MKKLVLSLLGAATLAVSSNAMALDVGRLYSVFIQRGVFPVPVGVAEFEFDSDIAFPVFGAPGTIPPEGACQYDMQWINQVGNPAAGLPGGLGLSAECFLVEPKSHGSASCLFNLTHDVPSILQANTSFPAAFPGGPGLATSPPSPCMGFDYFQNFQTVAQMSLGEPFAPPGAHGILIEGLVQFVSALQGASFFGIALQSL